MRLAPYSFTVYPKTTRLDIQLNKPDDSSYNAVNYAKLLNLELGNDITSSDFVGLTTEDTFDRFKDYEEESYIDNSEVYRDTLQVGKEPELGGFYINTGKLKLKSTLPESNSVDKNKKEGKKQISAKSKNTRKKEDTLPQFKNLKHGNTKVKVHPKMYSNNRLDTLLKTVRKQKKNDIVKNIKMPNISKHCLITSASKKTKEICKITPNKKIRSTKKCSAKASSTTNMVLNSSKVTIPREDFLSSKTCSGDAYNLASNPAEVEVTSKKIETKKICKIEIIPKKKIHTSNKSSAETSSTNQVVLNSTEVTIPRGDFLASKTGSCDAFSLRSDLVKVEVLKEIEAKEICEIIPKKKIHSTKKSSPETSTTKVGLNSTEITLPKEDFLTSKLGSYDALSSTSDLAEVEILKEIIHSVNKSNNEHTIVKNNLTLKSSETVQAGTSKEMFLPSNKIAAESYSTKSSLPSNTTIPWNSCKTKFSREMVSKPSLTSNTMLQLHSPLATTIPKELSHLSSNSSYVKSSPTLDTKRALSISFPRAVPKKRIHSSSQVGIEPNSVTIIPVCKTMNSSSSPNAIIPKKIINSSRKVTTNSTSTANSPILNTAVCSNSSKASITAVRSNFSKSAIPKEVLHSSRKVASDSAFIADSPVLNTAVISSSSKAIIPKEVFYSSTGFQGNSPKMTVTSIESIPANNRYSCIAGNWDNLMVNTTNPKAVSKYMLNVIHDKNVNSTLSNNTSVIPSSTRSNFSNYENSLQSTNSSVRSHSKTPVPRMQYQSDNMNLFQPIMKPNPVATSSAEVSQPRQTILMNSTYPSSNTTSVNMYKMNISPIVRHRKPDGKF